ncbi:SGNH/GDSL hydrolase family protein [Arcicella sp. DC2W]|uniref:SGNH/GDSL hydrolase family protein n=1 Tax=Arcicella gelida TaxID=2984195 RepID=A0ABU5S7S1_9BACT|nr:SGNH/GDSL hydrolase family protein [Arcicella sp. DC2W]MEA5404510.1 SGNH/GDSL hydrolase family protein [Arcicella sp. DC2W]
MSDLTTKFRQKDSNDRTLAINKWQNVGTRIFGGRMGTYSQSATYTHQITLTVEQHFDAVRIIHANTFKNGSFVTTTVGASVISSLTDANNSGGTWYSVIDDSNRGFCWAMSPADSRIEYNLSEWIPIKSIPRTDGGTLPLLVVRSVIKGNTLGIPCVGDGSDVFSNWATNPSGRIFISRRQQGDFVSSPTGFSSTTNLNQSAIVGVQYASRGKVITVMGNGDSITDSRGTYLGQGFIYSACQELTTPEIAVEYANCGWSGQSPQEFYNRGFDILQSEIKPDVLVFPSNSPNIGEIMNETIINTSAGLRNALIAECTKKGVIPVMWTMLPVNNSQKNFGSSDALRVADNLQLTTLAANSNYVFIADTATALSGTTIDNQVQMLIGSTDDGIHPNDTGNDILKGVIKETIKKATGL